MNDDIKSLLITMLIYFIILEFVLIFISPHVGNSTRDTVYFLTGMICAYVGLEVYNKNNKKLK